MKIKHWQGYGSIDAKGLCDYAIEDGRRKCIVELSGNHEWGLVRNNRYDVFKWLLNGGKRFAKSCESESSIEDCEIHDMYDEERKTDVAVYEITYRPAR